MENKLKTMILYFMDLFTNLDGAVFSILKPVGLCIMVWDQWGNVAAAISKLVAAPLGSLEMGKGYIWKR